MEEISKESQKKFNHVNSEHIATLALVFAILGVFGIYAVSGGVYWISFVCYGAGLVLSGASFVPSKNPYNKQHQLSRAIIAIVVVLVGLVGLWFAWIFSKVTVY